MHEWVKELGLKGPLAQFADSATDHVGAILNGSNLKDIAFFTSWLTLAYLLFKSGVAKELMAGAGGLSKFANIALTGPFGGFNLAQWGLNVGWTLGLELFGGNAEKPQNEEQMKAWYEDQMPQIGLSLVIAYIILNNGTDIAGAVLAIGGKI